MSARSANQQRQSPNNTNQRQTPVRRVAPQTHPKGPMTRCRLPTTWHIRRLPNHRTRGIYGYSKHQMAAVTTIPFRPFGPTTTLKSLRYLTCQRSGIYGSRKHQMATATTGPIRPSGHTATFLRRGPSLPWLPRRREGIRPSDHPTRQKLLSILALRLRPSLGPRIIGLLQR